MTSTHVFPGVIEREKIGATKTRREVQARPWAGWVNRLAQRWNLRARRRRARERVWQERLARVEAECASLDAEVTERWRQEVQVRRELAVAEAASAARGELLETLEWELRGLAEGDEGAAKATLGRLASELRELREIESGALRLAPVDCELGEFLQTALDAGVGATPGREIDAWLEVGAAVPARGRIDARRVGLIVERLVAHATTGMARGEVQLRVRFDGPRPGGFRLRGEINAAGIADWPAPARPGGGGVGLMLCRRLIGLMNGELTTGDLPGLRGTVAFAIDVGWADGKLVG